MKSSFPGIVRYSGERGKFYPTVFDWLEVKRRDDNIGNLWRVHDKLYNLDSFISKHPGGSDWIDFSRGTDITEAFESSHIVRFENVEKILAKYYVEDATTPRNSPYIFKEDGFYKTLKRRAGPILQKVGMGPSSEAILIQDSLLVAYVVLAFVSVSWSLTWLQLVTGVALGLMTVGGHNFFHKKDSWRRFYFDAMSLSSYEARISHAFSHHMYPNTVLDYEVLIGEPLVEMLPMRPKHFFNKYVMPFFLEFSYGVFGIFPIPTRILKIIQGKQKLRPENLLVILELVVFMVIAPSASAGLRAWTVIMTSGMLWALTVSYNSSHHHPHCFHDGDESRPDPDFGLCQLDATGGKTDWYHQNLFSVLTTFGEHPMHHLFPTVCHGKLKYLKPVVEETLAEFSEEFLQFTQWQLLIGTHRQMGRTERHKFRKNL